MAEQILITGGTGFAGSHLVELLLLNHDPATIHVTHVTDAPEYMKNWLPSENFHQVDLTYFEQTSQVLTQIQPTQIYHLAGIASAANSLEQAQTILTNNIQLQLNLLQVLQKSLPSTKVLVVSSADGYGISADHEIPIDENHPLRPINPYAVSKITQDLLSFAYATSWQLPIVRVRPFNHIGERQTGNFAVATFAKQIVDIERGKQTALQVGNLTAVRDFTDVKDIVRAYQVVMEKGVIGDVYNLGSGVGTSMQEVVDKLCALATKEIAVEVDPTRMRPLDIPIIIANNEKVRALGWSPTIPLQDTLERVLAYWRTQ